MTEPLINRTNSRLVPDWLEDAAVLAGRELFAQAVSGLAPTEAQLHAARGQWDRSGENSSIGQLKAAYITRGRQVVVACAGPFLTQLEQRDTEIGELRAGRGHYTGRQT